MKAEDLKEGMKVWCWWASRYLWFICKNSVTGEYKFGDAGDDIIYMNESEIVKLRIEK